MTKVLISNEVNGLGYLNLDNEEMFNKYFDEFGLKYHKDIGCFIKSWVAEPRYHYTIKIVGEVMLDWEMDNKFRTDPEVHRFFAENGLLDDKTKIIEIPDDVDEWYVGSWEDGSEYISETHRSWDAR
jgi:hypothetical protein